NYMNMYTDFEQAYHSLEQSAIDLYGEGSAEVGAIKNSFASVGIAENETMQMQPFKDITLDYWAYEYIEDLANRGIIKGYEDGTFRPNNPLT
ncbi:S-layer homology domain-containing protein, partial [Garciella nitratireducens]|uniref:S-layer homology domain-containing protein n=1 Tax=Garciella nitratireducens TaxID=218205 RepID=UPI000DFBA584